MKATRDDTGTSTEGPSVEEDPSSGTVAAPPRQEVLSGGTDAAPPRQDVLASGEDQIRAAQGQSVPSASKLVPVGASEAT